MKTLVERISSLAAIRSTTKYMGGRSIAIRTRTIRIGHLSMPPSFKIFIFTNMMVHGISNCRLDSCQKSLVGSVSLKLTVELLQMHKHHMNNK